MLSGSGCSGSADQKKLLRQLGKSNMDCELNNVILQIFSIKGSKFRVRIHADSFSCHVSLVFFRLE